MRLDRLDLARYGHFTDVVIDFPPPAPGAPDLHVIYGPNEAGKSTLTQAWLDLLYGIPHQSRMAFLHDGAALRIGARLALPDGVREVVRRKGTKATLSDPAGNPLPEALIGAATGGIDREAARAMFTLDDESIERGGEAILESRGELGRLLFAATAGLTALGPRLQALRDRADGLHKARAQKTVLAGLRREIEELDRQRRAIDVDRARHQALTAAVATAEAQVAAAAAALGAARAELAARQAEERALPLAAERARALAALAALGPLPEAPPGAEGLGALRAALAEADARLATLGEEAAAAEAEAAAIQPDPVGLGIGPALEAAEAMKAAHDEALKDLPKRRAELAARLAEADRIAAALCPGLAPASVALGAARLAELRARLGPGIRAAEAAQAAAREAAAAAAALAAARPVGEAPDPAATAALAALVARLQARDPVQAAATAERTAARALALADAAFAALAPWQGDAATLAAAPVPEASALARLVADEAAAEAGLRQARQAADAAAAALAAARAAATERPTPEALAAARAAREAAWAVHRRALDAATAQAFEAAMRRDDALQARGATGEGLAAPLAAAAQAETGLAQAEAAAAQVADRRRAALAAIGLPADWTAAALRDWADRRRAALEAAATAAAAEAEAHAARRAADEAAAALAGMLGVAPAGLDALMATAAAVLEARRAAAAEAAEAARLAEAAAARAKARDAAEAARADWARGWAAAVAGTWLETRPAEDFAALGATLESLGALEATLSAAADLAGRIAAMERNRAAFAVARAALAAAAGEGGGEAEALWLRLRSRAGAAAEAHRQRASALRRAAEARRRMQEAASARAADAGRLEALVAALGVPDAGAAAALLDRIGMRDRLRADVARLDTLLTQAMRATDPAAAAAALEGLDAATAAARVAAAELALDAAQAEAARARSAADRAAAALAEAGGGDAVARLVTLRATKVEEAAEAAREHLALALGLAATDAALRLYRDRHRSGMLARASAAFAAITCGAYRGLATAPAEGGDILLAEAASGPSRPAAALSRGTRMQLYLALRVAGYREIAAARPPMPFVGDDIMETFDDDRTAAAFGVLAEMAGVGQVIYLTHHAHVCAIAARVCPSARILRLPAG
jgi:uncharacterized protein YhaN